MPKMEKSPPELVERFDTVAAEFPEATRRLTFGYPCLYVGGNMVSGLFESSWHVKLGPDERAGARGDPGQRTVRADARPSDDRFHAHAVVDHRRRPGDPALGPAGDRVRGDAAAQGPEGEEAEGDEGIAGTRRRPDPGPTGIRAP